MYSLSTEVEELGQRYIYVHHIQLFMNIEHK